MVARTVRPPQNRDRGAALVRRQFAFLALTPWAGPYRSCLVPPGAVASGMPDADRLTPASSEDLADALAFALRYSGRKRVNDASEMMAAIVAGRRPR